MCPLPHVNIIASWVHDAEIINSNVLTCCCDDIEECMAALVKAFLLFLFLDSSDFTISFIRSYQNWP